MSVDLFPAKGGLQKRVDLITSTGTWTAPAGVTYAIAYLVSGGGGGGGRSSSRGSTGGASSAFGFSHNGGRGGAPQTGSTVDFASLSAAANSGQPSSGAQVAASSFSGSGQKSTIKIVGSAVTPGTGYTITIGAGGAGGADNGSGGSGYVSIEYWIG